MMRQQSRDKKKATTKKVHAIQLERGCWNCGYRKNLRAIDFAHIDRLTKYRTKDGVPVHISKMLVQGGSGPRYSENTILREINKCMVLCRNCHAEFDFPEANTGLENYQIDHDTAHTPAQFIALYEAYRALYEPYVEHLKENITIN